MECAICLSEIDIKKTIKCGHTYCRICVDAWLKISNKCPDCKENVNDNGLTINSRPARRITMRNLQLQADGKVTSEALQNHLTQYLHMNLFSMTVVWQCVYKSGRTIEFEDYDVVENVERMLELQKKPTFIRDDAKQYGLLQVHIQVIR